VEALVERRQGHQQEKVTEGHFVLVAIDQDRKPIRCWATDGSQTSIAHAQ